MKADSFSRFALDQLSGLEGVSCRAMFGGHGLYCDRRFFGILWRGRLFLKVDERSRPDFVQAGMSPFTPGGGRTMESYYEAPADVLEDRERLTAWARRAVAAGSSSPSLPRPQAERRRGEVFAVHPATAGRWEDLVALFGPRGACAGCWCMYWRVPRSQYQRNSGAGNRRGLRRLIAGGSEPGLIGYVDGEPAAWCALAPRAEYSGLARSRVLAPVDDRPVWSITCFFVARRHRRKGLTVRLLREAVRHAARRGARVMEGYPVEPARGTVPDVFAWTGLSAAFRRAGFTEVARRSATRPIMRRALRPRDGKER